MFVQNLNINIYENLYTKSFSWFYCTILGIVLRIWLFFFLLRIAAAWYNVLLRSLAFDLNSSRITGLDLKSCWEEWVEGVTVETVKSQIGVPSWLSLQPTAIHDPSFQRIDAISILWSEKTLFSPVYCFYLLTKMTAVYSWLAWEWRGNSTMGEEEFDL